MSPYLEGFVRARQMEISRTPDPRVVDEVVRARNVRYRVGRRLVAIGAQMMGPATPVIVVDSQGIRPAA